MKHSDIISPRDRVEAHPHRPKVLAGEDRTVSTRITKPGEKVTYLASLSLVDASFVYQPSGQARVDVEGQRNVHAWVRGTVVWAMTEAHEDAFLEPLIPGWIKVTYNPFKAKHFFRVDVIDGEMVPGPKVIAAKRVLMSGGNCWAFMPTYGEA